MSTHADEHNQQPADLFASEGKPVSTGSSIGRASDGALVEAGARRRETRRARRRQQDAPVAVPVLPSAFELALRALMQDRLAGRLDYEAFARRQLEIHQQFDRDGYTQAQLAHDLRTFRGRARAATPRIRPAAIRHARQLGITAR